MENAVSRFPYDVTSRYGVTHNHINFDFPKHRLLIENFLHAMLLTLVQLLAITVADGYDNFTNWHTALT